MAPASKAQQKATAKYKKNNYDRAEMLFPKGRKDEIKAHAESKGESMNGYILRLIETDMSYKTKNAESD